MDLTKYIKKILVDKDIKQSDIADKLGVSRSAISGFLSRGDKMSIDSLEGIAAAIDCELDIAFIDKQTGKRY